MRGRLRLLRPALWATMIVLAGVALVTRVLRLVVPVWLDVPSHGGLWSLLVATALVTTLGLGGACLWHAAMLMRLVRVRRIDIVIALLGGIVVVLAIAVSVLAGFSTPAARALLMLTSPLWVGGAAAIALAGAIALHVRGQRSATGFATVLILGAGLRGRDVGPLLRRRVVRGAEVWRASLARWPQARIVVAGGQGSDEVRTEASAMAEFLERQMGVPSSAIDVEDASTTTAENLAFSRPMVTGPGRAPLAVVTSEYHAYRTAWLLAKEGINGQVLGAWTRRSYLPGAVVREAMAVAADHRWWCVAASLALWALAAWMLTQPA